MHLILYLRKSREEIEKERQTGEDILSAHRSRLVAYCRNNMHTWEEYSELVSGDTIANRPVFTRVLDELIPTGNYQGILVHEVSRLGRGDMEDAGRIMKTFLRYNISIITPHKTYDLSNTSDARYIRFELFLAREEFELIRERLAAGKDYKARLGYAPNFLATLGVDSIRGKIFIIEEEAELVREIFEMRAKEMSFGEVAEILNARGLITKRGTKYHHTTIKRICTNPRYIGKNKWKGELITSQAPGIVNVELFNKVQEINNTLGHNLYRSKNEVYLVVLYCRECGNRMYGESQICKRGEKIYNEKYIYRCNGRRAESNCVHSAPIHEIHSLIYKELLDLFNDKELLNKLIEQRNKGLVIDTQKILNEIKEYQRKIKQLNNYIVKLDRDYATGDLLAKLYSQQYEQSLNQITAHEEMIKDRKKLLESAIKTDNTGDIIEKVKLELSEWDSLPNTRKKLIIKKFLPRIELSRSGELYIIRNLPNTF